MQLNEKIKHYRKQRKLSQQQLADLIGVKRSTIAGYENGNINPSLEVAMKLSEVLNAPITTEPKINNQDTIDIKIEINKLINAIETHSKINYNNQKVNTIVKEYIVEDLIFACKTIETLIKLQDANYMNDILEGLSQRIMNPNNNSDTNSNNTNTANVVEQQMEARF